MAKVRMTIEFDIDEDKCTSLGVTPKEVLDNITINENDVIDGYEIYPCDIGLDVASDFVLGKNVDIISKSFV